MVETMRDRLLTLTPDEHAELLAILEQAYLNLRVEERRTEALSGREKLLHKVGMLQALLDKLRQPA